jgi:transcription initiation factor TFIIF subunit alpha
VDDDLDDLFETEKSRKVDKEGKKLRKVLNKTEGGVYDSDDDDEDGLNPYLSRSDIENDDDDENEETAVKTEEDGSQLLSGRRAFYATNLGNSFVSIKAPMGFLSGFPRGDWNPQGFKRQAEMATPLPSKKVKIEENKSVSPTPSSSVDLHSAGPNNDLVTVEEVLNIVRKEPLTTKQLLLVLKNRVYAHPDNKLRIINIVKQNLRLSNGMLVLKEEH